MKKILYSLLLIVLVINVLGCGLLNKYSLNDVLGYNKKLVTKVQYSDARDTSSQVMLEANVEEIIDKLDVEYGKHSEGTMVKPSMAIYYFYIYKGENYITFYWEFNKTITVTTTKGSFYSKEPVELLKKELTENNYNFTAELIAQPAYISSIKTDFSVEIKNKTLFIEGCEEMLLGDLTNIDIYFEDLNIYTSKEEIIRLLNRMQLITQGYIINITNNIRIIILQIENRYYMLQSNLNEDVNKYCVREIYYLNEYVQITFEDYPGGCLIWTHQVTIKKGAIYSLNEVTELLTATQFIDLDTLEVYQNEIKADKDLSLVVYRNGVYDRYIIQYLRNNSQIEFLNEMFTKESLIQYDYKTLDNGDIQIIKNEYKYTFAQSKQLEQSYYLYKVEGNTIFNNIEYEETINRLLILYGNTNFNSVNISIDLSENNFIILLKELVIAG